MTTKSVEPKNEPTGARTGAGRPKSGKNTVTISFSVHRDYAEVVKLAVKAKVAELKGATHYLVPIHPSITFTDPTQPVRQIEKEIKIITEKTPISNKAVKNEAAQSFLDKRRAGKLK